jgi:hypothetical protein
MRKSIKVGAVLGGGAAFIAAGAYLLSQGGAESAPVEPKAASCSIVETPQLLGKVILQTRTPEQIKGSRPNPNTFAPLKSVVGAGEIPTEYIVVHGLGFSAEPGASAAEIAAVNQYNIQKAKSAGGLALGLSAITSIPEARITEGALIETPVKNGEMPTYTSTFGFSGDYEVDVYGVSIAQEQEDALAASGLVLACDFLS